MTGGATGRGAPISASGVEVGPGSLSGRWSVVPGASTATFAVRDKLMATARGSLPVVAGGATVDARGLLADVWLELDVAGVDTGNAHRDRDLRKARFLDADGHPTIRVDVRSSAVTDSGWTLSAAVHARGQEAPVDLVAELADDVPEGGVRVVVRGRLDRAPLRLPAPSFVIGRTLDLEAHLVLRRGFDVEQH